MWFHTSVSALWLTACALSINALDSAGEDVKSIPLRTHMLQQPYLDSDMQSRWWDFGGDAIVRTDKYIRLTSDRPSRDGWLWSRVPLTATNWEIEVDFAIHGAGNLHGDGLAMWLTRRRTHPGPVFGSEDKFEGLGIFFDTYKNNRPGTVFPYVMAMVGDGKTVYDKNNDGKANEYAGCSARGIRGATVPTKARLTYFQDKSIKLELLYKMDENWVTCFERDDPPTLPNVAYLGFSAETGELSDNHDIISVSTKNLYSSTSSGGSPQRPGNMGSARQRAKDGISGKKGGSWTWFLFKIVLFFGVIAGGYVGYTVWKSKNGRRSHRF